MTQSSTQDVLNAVIATGQSSRVTIDAGTIARFIAMQPDVAGKVVVSNLRGNANVGASSGIILFSAEWDDGTRLCQRELVLRHSPGSEARIFYKYDLARQFRVQRAMQGSGVPVPDGLWLDADGSVLGLPGYIMDLIPGEAPNPSAFAVGPMARATPEDRDLMVDQILRSLVTIHQLDFAACGLADFSMPAEGASPTEKCINWYWETWDWIQQPDHARLAPVRRWLLDNAPIGGETLTHGDSTLHNYMFVGNRLTSVLDWEMSCIARPENDLALQTLGNELFAAPIDSGAPQPPSQAQWVERYVALGGREPADLDYYRRFCAYMVLIAITSVQRAMPAEVRQGQRGFMDRLWTAMEAA